MYGPGPLPPPPGLARRIAVVVLRILLALIPPATLGILGWVPLVRLALLRGRARDWLGCAGMALLCTAAFVLTGYTNDENDWQSNTGLAALLLLAAFNSLYFFAADVNWHRQHTAGGPAWSGRRPPPAAGRPYLGASPLPGLPPYRGAGPYPVAPTHPDALPYPGPEQFLGTRPAQPDAARQPGGWQPGQAAAYPPPPPPAPQPPAPASPGRLDRVRAELDELSAYLRAQEEP